MRSFTIVKINSSDRRVKSKSVGGRFQSANPASAAKKAGSSVCRLNNINSSIKFKIAIRETTQGSSHKIFAYNFLRVRNPITVMRSGKPITYEFETKVKSLKRSPRHDGTFDPVLDIILDDDAIRPVTRVSPIYYDPRSADYKQYRDIRGSDDDDDLCNDDLTDDIDEKNYITNLLTRKNDLFKEEKELLNNRVDILRNCIMNKRIEEQQQLLDQINSLRGLNKVQQNEMDKINALMVTLKSDQTKLYDKQRDLEKQLQDSYDEKSELNGTLKQMNDIINRITQELIMKQKDFKVALKAADDESKEQALEIKNLKEEMDKKMKGVIDNFDYEESENALKNLVDKFKKNTKEKEEQSGKLTIEIQTIEEQISRLRKELKLINNEMLELKPFLKNRLAKRKIEQLNAQSELIHSELKKLKDNLDKFSKLIHPNPSVVYETDSDETESDETDYYSDKSLSEVEEEEDGRRRRRKSAKKSVKKTKKSMKASRKSKRKNSRRKNSRRRM